ncbi:hypothetical protein F4083_06005, partial [Candidatus Poribacteria bacterium]|nr:hypothetical protein [Candidatus Poribacteria bacterium]
MNFQPMKLEEKHKEFAVKCYAQFMTRTQVTKAFMEEFVTDITTAYIQTSKSKMPQALLEELMMETAQETPKHAAYRTEKQKLQTFKSGSDKFDKVREHYTKLKSNLSDRLRRLNIT